MLHQARPLLMYISNKPHAPRQMASEPAGVDAADAASAEPAPSCRPGDPEDRSAPSAAAPHIQDSSPSSASSHPPSSATGPLPGGSPIPRRTSLPISLPPIFFQRSKLPSASLAPSTAEGRPVPVTDPTDAHRTSALQKLNSKYPSAGSRHGYTPGAPSAQSSTYSQPVLVRTYSGPLPSQGSRTSRSRHHRPPSSGRTVSRRVPLPSASTLGSGASGQPIQPTVSGVGVGTTSSVNSDINRHVLEASDSAYGVTMPRPDKPKKSTPRTGKLPLPWPWHSSRQEPEEPKLPPIEAFSFKSFMADLQAPGGDNDISADLDRIAEICARSRYSLSNQYEVHVAPHCSSSSFTSGAGPSPSSAPRTKGHSRSRSHGHSSRGPTLQAITSDDEASTRPHPRSRTSGRRRSAAYGTLETIMSSSRSSEEDKSKKKSAAELAGEVRGRAARKAWGHNPSTSASASASASTGNSKSNATTNGSADPQLSATITTSVNNPDTNTKLARKKSASFATAIIDTNNGRASGRTRSSTVASSSRHHRRKPAGTASSSSSSALLSEPALPQTSGSHLGVRTAPVAGSGGVPGLRPAVGSGGGGGGGHERGEGDVCRGVVEDGGGLSLQGEATAAGSRTFGGGGTGPSSWGGWIPWKAGGAQAQEQSGELVREPRVSHAEGSLRLLLKGTGGLGEGQVGS
ncbi:hypothetical protein N658DRAFT_199399 [Parathielavia hyrcaniae]|uniref:Uncharacterized protein n=1 Tax=Parathielavia hyrcaniae TaxID=113614 RepID=A0AAN6T4P2_9PEZI|nr:hypothetical protein N658DRAFT_199399 [Parathielavia hyrcaniae]